MVRKTHQSGQALVAATLGLVALLGATGLAVDVGYLRYQKRLQQSAADSAALAGATDFAFGGDFTTAAKTDASLNGFTDGSTINNNPNLTVTVTVNHPPASGPNAPNPNAVEVLVSAIQPTFFMRIFGVNQATVTARAVAVFKGANNCIYSLGGAIDNDEVLNVPNCGILSNAQVFNGGNPITAASIGAVSGPAPGNTTPATVTPIVPTSDPLASSVTPPPIFGCLPKGAGSVDRFTPQPVRLNPGNYCDGISVTGGLDVTLNQGVYVVTGVGITFSGSGTVSGTGVTFYVSGPGGTVHLHNSQRFNLAAPTADPYAGILFYQDAGNANPATIDAAGGSKLQGAFYFPGAALTVNGGAAGADYMIFVAQSMEFSTDVHFLSDYSSLAKGSPIKDAVLVE